MQRIAIQCHFGDDIKLVDFLIAKPADGLHPLAEQAAWLLRQRGGTVPASVMNEIQDLLSESIERSVSFEELIVQYFGSSDYREGDGSGTGVKARYRLDSFGELIPVTEKELSSADTGDLYILTRDHGKSLDGRDYWLYIAVEEGKYAEFVRQTAVAATVRFRDYGRIIRYGYARQVPAESAAEIAQKYGFSDDYISELTHEYNNTRVAILLEQMEPVLTALARETDTVRQQRGSRPGKISIPCNLGSYVMFVDISIGEPAEGVHPIAQQFAWLAREQGITLPAMIMNSFQMVFMAAQKSNISYPELMVCFMRNELALRIMRLCS